MSSFTPSVTPPAKKILDPTKHVNFLQGMVLGEDDFRQEFTYLSNRDQWLARDLLGYGTVCGLKVSVGLDTDAINPRVEVATGVALDPQGQLIRVDPPQCAFLDPWLAEATIQAAIPAHLMDLSPIGDSITLYLTLCYRECFTESRPMPGEPCRVEGEADLLKPARVGDDFSLELRWLPPEQAEEDALRDFVAWLRQVKVREIVPSDPDQHLKDFIEAVRQATYVLASPPASPPNPPDFLYGSPPASLEIPGSRACEYLRLAFQIWTTELRPLWKGQGGACGLGPDEQCVLLAALHVPVVQTASGWVVNTAVFDPEAVIDEARRPYLIHLRLVQEWLTCGHNALLVPADTVRAEQLYNLPTDPGESELYSRADHTHGSPSDVLTGDVTGTFGDNTVTALQDVPLATSSPVELEVGQVLALEETEGGLQWTPTALDGDVTGPVADNTVSALQGIPLVTASPISPAAGDVLTLRTGEAGLEWIPAQLDGEVSGPADNTRVAAIQTLSVNPAAPRTPRAGQVLMLATRRPADEERIPPGGRLAPTRLQWHVADLPAVPPQNMVGDVHGTTNNNRIDSLQGSLVAIPQPPTTITSGHVLTFQRDATHPNGHWVPAPPSGGSTPPPFVGDVINNPRNSAQNWIDRLQDRLVFAPQPQVGNILRYSSPSKEPLPGEPREDHWRAVEPTFVNSQVRQFEIMAAGVYDLKRKSVLSSYNHLKERELTQDQLGWVVQLTYGGIDGPGYAIPDPEMPNLIVKLTAWVMGIPFTAVFNRFLDEWFEIGLIPAPGIEIGKLTNARVMVEISQFTPDPR